MLDPRTNSNCILSLASRIAQGQPISRSQALDLCRALGEYFSEKKFSVIDIDEDSRRTFGLVARAVKGVVDQEGLPPGYVSKYESDVDDTTRRERVRRDYEVGRTFSGNQFRLDSIWE